MKKLYDKLPTILQNVVLTGYSALLDRERYGGRYKEYRELMKKSQWYSKEEINQYQNQQLKSLIKHAYDTVPYYYNVFRQNGLKPADIQCVNDLYKLPVLTRDDIKTNFSDLISSVYRNKTLKAGHTSGTTGSPLEVLYDDSTIYITYAALDRHYQWAGVNLSRFGDKVAVARGNTIVPLSQKQPPFWRYNYLHRQLLLSSFHFSKQNLPYYFEELAKFNPKVIDGYPSTLYVLAKYLKASDQKFPVHAIISSSETLYDFQRELIEDRFQCKIFDYYALAERVVFATECESHQGHHLNSEYGITEIVDKDGMPVSNGTSGVLVGTSLHNYAMPLIRYKTNDMTSIRNEKCACGRNLPLMDDIATKAEDTITLKDGRLISPSTLTHPFKPLHSIEASQILQEDLDHIIIKLVPNEKYNEGEKEHIMKEFRARLGDDVSIDVQLVEQLERMKSGKFKWVISKVKLGM